MKKIIVIIFCLSTIVNAKTRFGKYAGEFMAIGIGGRALGMGSAYTALANDVTAAYWNPAGLSRITYPELALMHDERFGNLINYDYAAVALPFGANSTDSILGVTNYNASSFGFSIIRLGVDEIADTRKTWIDTNGNGLFDDGSTIRPDLRQITYFNAADWVLYFTYSKQHSENFYYGANLKLIRRDITEFHGTGIGVDIAALFSPMENLFLGANLQDATTTLISWNTGTTELISPTLKFGAAYSLNVWEGKLTPSFGADFRNEGRTFSTAVSVGPISMDPYAGIEYDFKNIFALRAGYNDIGNLTLGAGVHLRKIDIDYSFAKFNADDELGNTHRISLRVVLQEEKYKRGE